MADPRKPSLSVQVAPNAGPDAKDLKYDSSTSEDTPSLRSEDLVVGDYGSDSNHVFSDPKVADHWRGVYEKAQYEGLARFDPHITWSAEEEKRLRRKVSQCLSSRCLTLTFLSD